MRQRRLAELYYGRRKDYLRPTPRDGWDKLLAGLAYIVPFFVSLLLLSTSARRPFRYFHAMQAIFLTLFLWAAIMSVIGLWYGITSFFYSYSSPGGSGEMLWGLWAFHFLVTWYFGWRALRGNTFDGLWAATFLERMGWL